MSRLQRKVIVVGLSRLCAAGAAVVVNVVLARGLEREVNGLAQQTLLLAGVAILLGQSGVQASCYTFLPRLAPERRRGFFAQSAALLALLGAAAAAGALLLAPWLGEIWRNPRLSPLTLALAGYVFSTIAASATEAALLTQERQLGFFAATAAWAALHAGAVIALLLLGHPLEWVFLAMSAVALLRWLALSAMSWRALPAGPPWAERALMLQQIAFIAPLAAHGALDVFSRWMDRAIVSTLFSPEQLAVYSYGALEVPFVGVLISAITPVLLPEFSAAWARGDRARILDLWGRATLRTAACLLALMFFLLPLAEPFLDLLYKKYPDSAPYFRLYLLLLPVRTIAFGPMLLALGRPGWTLAGALVDMVLNLTLSVWLVGPLGMLGPAAGTVIATWIQAMAYLLIIRHSLRAPLTALLPWRRLGAQAAELAAVSLPLWALARMGAGAMITLAAGGLYGAAWAALRLRKIW